MSADWFSCPQQFSTFSGFPHHPEFFHLTPLWGLLRQLCHDDVSSGFLYHPGMFLDIHILFSFPHVPQHYIGFSYMLSNFHGTLMSPGCYLSLFDLFQLNLSTLLISLNISSMIFTGTSGLLMLISMFFFKFASKQFHSSTNVCNHAAKKWLSGKVIVQAFVLFL